MVAHRDVRHRLEQFAANPMCEANTLSAVYDVSMEDVAKAHGLTPKVGQSPFAIARGQMFERSLFENAAARLRKALIERKVLAENAAGFVDLRIKKNSGPMDSLATSRQAFRALLEDIASGTLGPGSAPAIVAGPSLLVPAKAILPDGLFAVDVLTIHPSVSGPTTLRVGEVKVYPDRGGFTDATELATTRAQAGLYVYALRVELMAWQLESKLSVADDGFLVLAKPGSNFPSIRPQEDLSYQAQRAHDVYAALHAAASAQAQAAPSASATPQKRLQMIQGAKTSYKARCLSFCELSDVCHDRALANGEGVVLGEALGKFLGSVRIDRAIELMHGGTPQNEAESELLGRLS